MRCPLLWRLLLCLAAVLGLPATQYNIIPFYRMLAHPAQLAPTPPHGVRFY